MNQKELIKQLEDSIKQLEATKYKIRSLIAKVLWENRPKNDEKRSKKDETVQK